MRIDERRADAVSAADEEPTPALTGRGEPGAPARDTAARRFDATALLGRYAVVLALLVMLVAFSLLRPDTFFTIGNFKSILVTQSILIVLALGLTIALAAGEFDLSIGSMIGFTGMVAAIPPLHFGWPVWLSMVASLGCALVLGFVNGQLVVRTGLPSFIVTLAFLFVLRGLTLAFSVIVADRTIVSGIGDLAERDPVAGLLFSGTFGDAVFGWLARHHWIRTLDDGTPLVRGIPKVLLWWAAVAAACSFQLTRTRFGNWIFAVGGDAGAAKNMGVPVQRVKVSLFMFTALCGWLFAMLQICDVGSAAADRGLQKEFEAVIAAVIGGSLLTGGYGSVIGACLGALIFGVVQIGITYTNLDPEWFRVFLGGMLLIAVLFNHQVRRRVTQAR
jgi:simple sugar transport system permease protein